VTVPHDPYTLPTDLPAPVDDGAAAHLDGAEVPPLSLESWCGPVDLAELSTERGVVYVYPRTGRPGVPAPDGWDAFPGARGCTPQSCAFRDHAGELARLGARVAGMSTQTLAEQVEFAERNHMPFPVLADPRLELRAALALPTPDGNVWHASGRIGGGEIMMGDPGDHYRSPKRLGQETVGIYVIVADVGAHFEREGGGSGDPRGAGRPAVRPPALHGGRPEGQHWYFASVIRDVAPEEWGAQVASRA